MNAAEALATHGPLVTRIARRLVGGGAALDDLIQEGRIGLLVAVEHWRDDSPGEFAAFATVCIRNAVRAAAKRARGLARWGVTRSMDDEDGDRRTLHGAIGEPAAQERRCDVARLRQAIAQLPDREREILDAVADGCTYEEIGKRLNLTGARVRQIATATLEAMERRLAPRREPRPAMVKATPKPVRRGTKPRRLLEYQGRRLTKAQWARETGISFMTLSRRLAEGWDLATALETPVRATRLQTE